ncbi:MAG: RNA-binding cell elongation regulator Jag/EloR [bacterium]
MDQIVQEGKTREEALEAALRRLNVSRDQVEVEVVEEGGARLFGLMGARGVKLKVKVKERDEVEALREFLEKVIDLIGVKGKVAVEDCGDYLSARIEGEEAGILIGRFGQTLDSLEYITNVVLGKRASGGGARKVVLDAEGYREKRRISLTKMAKSLAIKVMKTKKSVVLDPMSAHDRRTIHMALSDSKRVRTHSEGTGKDRKVIISYREK